MIGLFDGCRKMDYVRPFRVFIFLILGFFFSSSPLTGQIGNIAWTALQKYRQDASKRSVPAIRQVFAGMSDEEIIEEIHAYLVANDASLEGTPYSMPLISSSPFIGMLRNDPDLVSDVSHLRLMLKREEDPRKFFLLISLANVFAIQQKIEFSKEMEHMLLREGKVSNVPPEHSQAEYDDVGMYTYGVILDQLDRLKIEHPFSTAQFPSPTRLEIKSLKKWLEERRGSRGRSRNDFRNLEIGSDRVPKRPKKNQEIQERGEDSFYGGVLLVSIVGLLMAALFLLKERNERRRSVR